MWFHCQYRHFQAFQFVQIYLLCYIKHLISLYIYVMCWLLKFIVINCNFVFSIYIFFFYKFWLESSSIQPIWSMPVCSPLAETSWGGWTASGGECSRPQLNLRAHRLSPGLSSTIQHEVWRPECEHTSGRETHSSVGTSHRQTGGGGGAEKDVNSLNISMITKCFGIN